jgi:homoserine dehydrogenase
MQGKGAGPGPTSSALMSDLYSILRGNIKYPFITPYKLRKKIKQFNYSNYSYSCYFRFEVKDKPGVLSSITKNLGESKISIEKLIQIPDKKKRTASINIITHKTVEKKVANCLRKLKKNKHIISSPTFIRVGDINGN